MKPYPLKAKFVKVNRSDGSQDFDESCWVVCTADEEEKVFSRTTVKEFIAFDRDLDYDIIATREFGLILISKVRKRLNTLKAFW